MRASCAALAAVFAPAALAGCASVDEADREDLPLYLRAPISLAPPDEPAEPDEPARSVRRPFDEVVEDRVAVRLAESPTIPPAAVSVAVEDGVVRLAGEVPDAGARARAIRIASRTPGVREVQDDLVVTGRPREEATRTDDAALAQRVAEQVARAVYPEAIVVPEWEFGYEVEDPLCCVEFDVTADDGHILLVGTVRRGRDIRRVVEVARAVEGVRGVVSRLTVWPPDGPVPGAGRAPDSGWYGPTGEYSVPYARAYNPYVRRFPPDIAE